MSRRNRYYSKRSQASFKNLIIIGISMILILFFCCFFFNNHINVDAAEAPATKCFTSITVTEGENLTSIADEYMDAHYSDRNSYIDEVKQMNHLTSDEIHAGEHLTIPYYSNEV